MYAITKEFHFEAAHSLPHLPLGHKCRNVHGHSYRVQLVVEAERLDNRGFAGGTDYADLDVFGEYLRDNCDHRNLNDVLDGAQTTAEMLARHFWTWCRVRGLPVYAVRVSETARTWVEYRE
jgi:6-pyruvoyltetrahydropterin/6-carboxytetrahydropterin synthase